MADLPSPRVNAAAAFSHTINIDCAGPFNYKLSSRRNAGVAKCWLLVIICSSSSCVYLDIMTSMSAEAFQNTFERFTSRRGSPLFVKSDQGTNFTKSQKDYKEFSKFLSENKDKIYSSLANRSITWIFADRESPEQNGLAEKTVDLSKRLLKRTLLNQVFELEQFMTLAAKTEAILNSRPLWPLSADANDDLDFLTPSHFLIFRPMTAPPEPIFENEKSLLNKWQRVRSTCQRFWKLWVNQYLHSLNQRHKWVKVVPSDTIKIGSIVWVKELKLAPLNYPIGRITQVVPGSQDQIRSVFVKTKSGIIKSAVRNIILVPTD